MVAQLIWVTGAGGFIGTHLVQHFARKGDQVVGFGREPKSYFGCYASLSGGVDAETLDSALSLYGKPDRIFHLAGGATVGKSIDNPMGDFQSNVTTTLHLFDFLRLNKVDVPVTIASSAAIYGALNSGPIKLNSVVQPHSPYGHHKNMAENIARYYSEIFSMRCTLLRLFSVYGPGIEKQLLFDLCTRLNEKEGIIKLGGTGSELRDWCYVSDVVNALVEVPDPTPGDVQLFNIGSGIGTTISDVAKKVIQCWGDDRELEFSGEVRVGDPHSLVADVSSLPPEFIPDVDIERGIQMFVEWFKKRLIA